MGLGEHLEKTIEVIAVQRLIGSFPPCKSNASIYTEY